MVNAVRIAESWKWRGLMYRDPRATPLKPLELRKIGRRVARGRAPRRAEVPARRDLPGRLAGPRSCLTRRPSEVEVGEAHLWFRLELLGNGGQRIPHLVRRRRERKLCNPRYLGAEEISQARGALGLALVSLSYACGRLVSSVMAFAAKRVEPPESGRWPRDRGPSTTDESSGV
jgi:hypothetical protein